MEISLDLDVKNYNGGPKIKIFIDNELLFDQAFPKEGPQTVKINYNKNKIENFTIEHYGKDMNNDTLVDGNKIVSDKGFTLNQIRFGQIVLNNEISNFDFVKQDGTVLKNNNYIGFNGKYVINFGKQNLVNWYRSLQKSFINNQDSYDFEAFKQEIFQGKNYLVEY